MVSSRGWYFIFCFLCSTFIVPSALSILIFTWSSFFFDDLMIMKFVLVKLIDNLFTSHHIFTFLSSELTISPRSFRLRAEAKTFVSSANILNARAFEQFGKSFMYIKNNTGPRELPCGIPQQFLDCMLSIFFFCSYYFAS